MAQVKSLSIAERVEIKKAQLTPQEYSEGLDERARRLKEDAVYMVSVLDSDEVTQRMDQASAKRRNLDYLIQQANWSNDLVGWGD